MINNLMSNPCNDCNDDCIKYNSINIPDYFIFGVDTLAHKQYWIPVNDALSIGGLNTYYDNYSEWFSAASPTYTTGTSNNFPIFKTLQEGISAAYAKAAELPPAVDVFVIKVINENYGNPIMSHPSILSWKWNSRQIPYTSLKDPMWLINFPICNLKNKFESNRTWSIKDCGIWKIEYRLRLRPIIPMEGLDLQRSCADWGITGAETFDKIRDMMRFYKSLESQNGSKAMGVAPMRIESGIYSHETLKEKPIVWSDGAYPQIIPNSRNYWTSKYPKEMSLNMNNVKTLEPTCPRNTWFIGPTEEEIIPNLESEPNDDIILYKYIDGALQISNGVIIPGSNSLSNPITLEFSNIDNVKSTKLYDWLKTFDLSGAPTKVGEIEIEIQGKIDGVWTTSTRLNYNISNITFNTNSILLNVNINTQNPIYENNLSDGYSNTEFYNFNNIQTRYSISINNYIPSKTVSAFNISNVVSKTYTNLTEDFVVELEGFTYVNLDKEKEVSIYLKVLPDHNTHGTGGINPVNDITFGQTWYSTVQGNSNVNVAISASGTWPWAPLSVDFRTGYREQNNVKYEPLLPLDLYWRNELSNLKIDLSGNFRRFLYPSDSDPNWHIMIEEGWVSAEKVCEDCNC